MSNSSRRYAYDYPRPAVSVDMVVYWSGAEGPLHVLLIERRQEPFASCWALPGGFLEMNETLEDAARRELMEETGLCVEELSQVGAFSQVDRDPRGRVISVAFAGAVTGDFPPTPQAGDDASRAAWFPVHELPELAFDHSQIIEVALDRQRQTFR